MEAGDSQLVILTFPGDVTLTEGDYWLQGDTRCATNTIRVPDFCEAALDYVVSGKLSLKARTSESIQVYYSTYRSSICKALKKKLTSTTVTCEATLDEFDNTDSSSDSSDKKKSRFIQMGNGINGKKSKIDEFGSYQILLEGM